MPKKVRTYDQAKTKEYKDKLVARFKTKWNLPSGKKRLFLSLGFSALVLMAIYIFWDLPNPRELTTHPAPASTKLLDRNGKIIYEIFSVGRRTPIKLDTLPKYVWQATLAAEDRDFYSHSGFSIRGISRALFSTFFKQNLQGGSTITQQLVKKALLVDDRTIRRKIRELVLSLAVENLYKKDEILELYLNQIPYGGTAYGLEAASNAYFGKPATALTLSEAALLAALPQAPSFYSPFGSRPELGLDRQKYILNQMLDAKFITQEEYDSAINTKLVFSSPPILTAPHFSLWVKDKLIEKYGIEKVEQDGLTVITTLDLELQNFAQDTVASEVAKLTREKVGNGAALVTNPKTGEVLAMVGSKDYFNVEDDGNVNVTLAKRQPGSSIKPITYAQGIENRTFTASTLLADKATCFIQTGQEIYCPQNYDVQFHGPTQVRFALGNSFNIPAVKALVLEGLGNFVASASAFGLSTYTDPTKYGPSIALGGGEVTMLDLSTAYGVLANAGKRVDLNPILVVMDRNGKILEQVKSREVDTDNEPNPYSEYKIHDTRYVIQSISDTRVISPGAAFIISHILYDPGARAATFGVSSFLNIPGHPEVSVKTGTTNNKRDNWTIGYTPSLLTAVWVGNNDNTPMSNVASGITGASPIWNKIMRRALVDMPQQWPSQPAEVVGTLVCSLSGYKAPDGADPSTCSPRYEYFLSGTVPAVQGSVRKSIPILRSRNVPATSRQITDFASDIEYQDHFVITDPLGVDLCLDCAGGYGDANTIVLDRNGQAKRY